MAKLRDQNPDEVVPWGLFSKKYGVMIINTDALDSKETAQRVVDHESAHEAFGVANIKLKEEAAKYFGGENYQGWYRLIYEGRNELITYYMDIERNGIQPSSLGLFRSDLYPAFGDGFDVFNLSIRAQLTEKGLPREKIDSLLLAATADGYQPLVDELGGWDKFFEFFEKAGLENSAKALSPTHRPAPVPTSFNFIETVVATYDEKLAGPCGLPKISTKKSALADSGGATEVRLNLASHLQQRVPQNYPSVNSQKGVKVAGFAPAEPWMRSQVPYYSTPTPLPSIASAQPQVLGTSTIFPCPLDLRNWKWPNKDKAAFDTGSKTIDNLLAQAHAGQTDPNFHGLISPGHTHTQAVTDLAMDLAEKRNLAPVEKLALKIAAYDHDLGNTPDGSRQQWQDAEERSAKTLESNISLILNELDVTDSAQRQEILFLATQAIRETNVREYGFVFAPKKEAGKIGLILRLADQLVVLHPKYDYTNPQNHPSLQVLAEGFSQPGIYPNGVDLIPFMDNMSNHPEGRTAINELGLQDRLQEVLKYNHWLTNWLVDNNYTKVSSLADIQAIRKKLPTLYLDNPKR